MEYVLKMEFLSHVVTHCSHVTAHMLASLQANQPLALPTTHHILDFLNHMTTYGAFNLYKIDNIKQIDYYCAKSKLLNIITK